MKNDYQQVKTLLRNAEAHADKEELDQADSCVREALQYGCSKHDISNNLTRGTLTKLREHTS